MLTNSHRPLSAPTPAGDRRSCRSAPLSAAHTASRSAPSNNSLTCSIRQLEQPLARRCTNGDNRFGHHRAGRFRKLAIIQEGRPRDRESSDPLRRLAWSNPEHSATGSRGYRVSVLSDQARRHRRWTVSRRSQSISHTCSVRTARVLRSVSATLRRWAGRAQENRMRPGKRGAGRVSSRCSAVRSAALQTASLRCGRSARCRS
jgi:hypothetical protein